MQRAPAPRLRALLVGAGAVAAVAAVSVRIGCAQEGGPDGDAGGHVREPLPPPEAIAELPPDGGAEFNRLVHESSPYLRQHARNPVDWYPWGPEAFEVAREEEKPIFLSVGYSTCHWCHVMERESFEDPSIAGLLNAGFVPVKVDREERPDVDAVYMDAVMTLTGRGGWPMSVFLTPDGRPFYGGTYFPPEDRFGRPGFPTLLKAIAEAWEQDRAALFEDAGRLTRRLKERSAGAAQAGGEVTADTIAGAYRAYASSFDADEGGFGGAPKFPRPHSLTFLLRYHHRTGEARALEMVERTLEAMARGGIRDHLGGGFHRYSTDAEWLVPHFEKMLYDQALLARAYLEAYQVTGDGRWADVARDVLEYVLRDLADPAGGFRSAEDADSEGVEGKFYLWTRDELLDVLGPEDGAFFARVYGVTAAGNYVEEATGERTGESILHLDEALPAVAEELDTTPAALEGRLAPLRAALLEARAERIRPALDDKVLTDWNGLVIGSLAYAGRVLGEARYVEAARRAATFVLDTMRVEGRLHHSFRAGDVAVPAFLDDHAFLAAGLLDLFAATHEARWLEAAETTVRDMLRLFPDAEGGGFFFRGTDGERLIARTKELYDGATPSGNSVAADALLRVGHLTADAELEAEGAAVLEAFAGRLSRPTIAYPYALMALDFALGPRREVVLAGARDDPALEAMLAVLNERYRPRTVVVVHPPGEAGGAIEALAPYVAAQTALEGEATAYVCRDYACELPTSDLDRFRALLAEEDDD